MTIDFAAMTLEELRTLLSTGLVTATGSAPGVLSYSLTPAGRIILANQLSASKRLTTQVR